MIFIEMDFVESCKIKPALVQSTVHQSVVLKLRPGVQEKGLGFWKIHNYMLHELGSQTLIDKHIENSENNQIDSTCRLVWDA